MKMDVKLSRRQFLKGAAIAGAGMALPLSFGVRESYAFYKSPRLAKFGPGQSLRGIDVIPVAAWDGYVPNTAAFTPAPVTGVKHYTINIQQFTDQLHPSFAPNSTTLWGYHPTKLLAGSATPKHLGGIIVAERGEPIQITFRNNLPPKHIIPVDTTIPGANQAQNRTAVHLHGGLVPWISDGGPFDWWAPDGTHGLSFLNNQVLNPGAKKNEAEYYYPNNQSARFVWYHDHAFGITRINAYAGIATGYIIRDKFERAMRDDGHMPAFIENGGREIPIVIQDKIFVGSDINTVDPTWGPGTATQKGLGLSITQGTLWYPHIYEKNRWKLIGAGSRLPNPSVVAEAFGDTMLVNGTVYPEVAVEPRRYRLRILNACNARFLNLQLYVADNAGGITLDNGDVKNLGGPDWLVIGNEAGFLQKPVKVFSDSQFDLSTGVATGSLITGNAERWDVIVDFGEKDTVGNFLFAGKKVILYNDAPAPFPGGDPRYDFFNAEGSSPDTRQIMRFNVGTTTTGDPDVPLDLVGDDGNWKPIRVSPALPNDPPFPGIDPPLDPTGVPVRRLTLNEAFDAYGRLAQLLGTDVAVTPGKFGRAYLDTPTEIVNNGSVEVWEIFNLTADTHPIHFHLVNVQVLNRQAFTSNAGGLPFVLSGDPRLPEPTELGWKETVQMHPGEVTRVIMKFVVPDIKTKGGAIVKTPPSPRTGYNEYVWHCHILEHEEHDMMRPLVVK